MRALNVLTSLKYINYRIANGKMCLTQMYVMFVTRVITRIYIVEFASRILCLHHRALQMGQHC